METSEPKIQVKFYADKNTKNCIKERRKNVSQSSSDSEDEYDCRDPKYFPFHDPSIRIEPIEPKKPEENK